MASEFIEFGVGGGGGYLPKWIFLFKDQLLVEVITFTNRILNI